eukprot:4552067-Amphidinium_carterae.1
MFVCAAGYAPVRASASQVMEVTTFIDDATVNISQTTDGDVVRSMVVSTLLISITTLVIAVWTSWRLCQQQLKPQTRDQSTQTPDTPDREVATTRVREVDDDIYIYQYGRRFHTRWHCRAVTRAKSQPRQCMKCQVCG